MQKWAVKRVEVYKVDLPMQCFLQLCLHLHASLKGKRAIRQNGDVHVACRLRFAHTRGSIDDSQLKLRKGCERISGGVVKGCIRFSHDVCDDMKSECYLPAARTASLIRFTCPRPSPLTSQPSSKKRRICSSLNRPKQSTMAAGRPVISTILSGSSCR